MAQEAGWIDIHIHSEMSEGEAWIDEIVRRADKIGLTAVAIADLTNDTLERVQRIANVIRKAERGSKIKLFVTADIRGESLREARTAALKVRKYADFVSFSTGDIITARWMAKSSLIDSIVLPSQKRGLLIDGITARYMLMGRTALELQIDKLGGVRGRSGVRVLSTTLKEIGIAKYYGVPIILSTNAKSPIEMKSAMQMMGIGCLLGLELERAKLSFSEVPFNIIMYNRKVKEKVFGRGR